MSRRSLRRDRRAIAALEFGLIAPAMILILIGAIELVNVFRIQSKLNTAAGQLVEMIAGSSLVTESSSAGGGGTLADMCTAASYNLLPYNPMPLSGAIQSATVNATPTKSVDWFTDVACPTPMTGGNATESTTLTNGADNPKSLFTIDGTPSTGGGTLVQGYSAISLQLTYVYHNVLPFYLSPSITMTAFASARPRSNQTVPCKYPSGNTTVACGLVY